jgi:hypothetical protein
LIGCGDNNGCGGRAGLQNEMQRNSGGAKALQAPRAISRIDNAYSI